ncbi:tetratricopeptide repeat protein [Pontibacter sp. G13]|uniref:tetratricopeptide repeat protein n=1 Tax=Pontibacter sp. G13 TaxID=3074898 RepID=UPI002889F0A7|nr:tetratricopeptide repeat protein [Pontibacter sp. G13]WNJ19905.1 tetratricopeptide repeat protein [Pontibacter sp. G13]
MKAFITGICLLAAVPMWGQSLDDSGELSTYLGNRAYRGSDVQGAQSRYMEALTANPDNQASTFNLGNALYQQGQYAQAAEQFKRAATMTENAVQQAEAYHNLGNSKLQEALAAQQQGGMMPQQQGQGGPNGGGNPLQESVEAYKQSLRRNPGDQDTRYNLSYAMKLLQQQQNQQQNQDDQNQDQQDKNQDQQDQNQDQQDQNQDQQDQNQEQQDQNQDQQQDENQEQQDQNQQGQDQQGQPQQPRNMTPEEIEQMLEALQYEEEKLNEELQKKKARAMKVKVEKDW